MNYSRLFIKSITVAVFILTVMIVWRGYVKADWVDPRAGDRPTPPLIDRDGRITLPTDIPTQPTTQPPVQPTATPKIGGPSITSVPAGNGGSTGGGSSSSSSSDDPCGSGKSYTGPYCGWSPSVSAESGNSGDNTPRIGGGPQVLGLSYTGGEGISWSDIISLTGVLCLLLYARSKITKEIQV